MIYTPQSIYTETSFYTTLVLSTVFTSQIAGVWLRFVLSKGWPLLSTNPEERQEVEVVSDELPQTRPATSPAAAATT